MKAVRDTIANIPSTDTNPLRHYEHHLGRVDSRLNIQQINMSDLQNILSKMSSTTSTTEYFISIRVLKEASPAIAPHLLHLVNVIFHSEKYPSKLKITKIVPIPKDKNDPNTEAGWRPINIVPSLSKVVEKCLLAQVLKYLYNNNFVNHSHHGSVRQKSTRALVQEIYEMCVTSLENDETSALIQLDESKAYDVVSHKLLIGKIKLLGFNRNTINIFKSYLEERKQYVVIDSFLSEKLLVGPRSVTQGLTLSCVLYLIFILDSTQIYHEVPHSPEEYSRCSTGHKVLYNTCTPTNGKTYIDDNLVLTRTKPNQTLQDAVTETIKRIEDYTNANLLALNPQK